MLHVCDLHAGTGHMLCCIRETVTKCQSPYKVMLDVVVSTTLAANTNHIHSQHVLVREDYSSSSSHNNILLHNNCQCPLPPSVVDFALVAIQNIIDNLQNKIVPNGVRNGRRGDNATTLTATIQSLTAIQVVRRTSKLSNSSEITKDHSLSSGSVSYHHKMYEGRSADETAIKQRFQPAINHLFLLNNLNAIMTMLQGLIQHTNQIGDRRSIAISALSDEILDTIQKELDLFRDFTVSGLGMSIDADEEEDLQQAVQSLRNGGNTVRSIMGGGGGSGGSGSAAEGAKLLKAKFGYFNAALDALQQYHSNWRVASEDLRDQLRSLLLTSILPPYRKFFEMCSTTSFSKKHSDQYLRYPPSLVEKFLTRTQVPQNTAKLADTSKISSSRFFHCEEKMRMRLSFGYSVSQIPLTTTSHTANSKYSEMTLVIILLLLGNELFLTNGDYPAYPTGHISEPSDEEISNAVIVRPTKAWGYFMRQEKTIRLLLIGGSNTEEGAYVDLLKQYILQNISSTSTVINMGVGGTGPEFRIGMPVFGVEHLPPRKWPNLVLLEYCVNSMYGEGTSVLMDQLLNIIKDKWVRYKARVPSFLMLEIFCIGWEYHRAKTGNLSSTPQDRVHALNTHEPVGINLRGAGPGMYHLEVARFYHIPYISTTDAMYPAFSRHFIAHNVTEEWAYNPVGCHFSVDGHFLLVDKILGPFLREQMEPHPSDALMHKRLHAHHHHHNYELQSIYDHNLRMHHPEVYKHSVIEFWGAWAQERADLLIDNFNKTFPETEHWKHDVPPNYAHVHYCFLSTKKDSVAKGFVSAPSYCNHTDRCEISIGYLRSWNSSYIGNLVCSLYSTNDRGGGGRNGHAARVQIGNEHLVNGSDKHIGGTVLNWDNNIFPNVPSVNLTIECRKPDNRLSCIGGLLLTRKPLHEDSEESRRRLRAR
eukprot:gene6126-12404_t